MRVVSAIVEVGIIDVSYNGQPIRRDGLVPTLCLHGDEAVGAIQHTVGLEADKFEPGLTFTARL